MRKTVSALIIMFLVWIGYLGFLTIWPDFSRPLAAQFQTVAERLKKIG